MPTGGPGWLDGLFLDATLNHIGRAYISRRNVARTEIHDTLDVGLRYSFRRGGRDWTVRARAVNLLNRFYRQPDASGTLYPTDQRQFDLSLRVVFQPERAALICLQRVVRMSCGPLGDRGAGLP